MRRLGAIGLIIGTCLSPTLSAWAQDDSGDQPSMPAPVPYQQGQGGMVYSSSGGASAMNSRETIELQNQILALRRDLQQVQQQQQSGGGSALPPPAASGGGDAGGANNPLLPQLLERVQTLEDQVRTLRGQVDQLQNSSQRTQQDLTKQLGDLQFQLQQSGQLPGGQSGAASQPAPAPTNDGGAGGTVQSPPPHDLTAPGQGRSDAAPPHPAVPSRAADSILHDANDALQRHDFAAAASAAQDLQRAGKHGYDAQFIMAQAKAGQRNYRDAALAYDDLYRKNPRGRWAQDGQLGIAVSLYNLGQAKAACGALRKLASEFPNERADVKQNAAALRGRAGC